MNEPLILEAFETVEKALLQGIQASALKDEVLREKCCQYLIVLGQIKGHLETTITTGKFAAKQLEEKKRFWVV